MKKIDLSNFNIASSEVIRNINRRIILNLIRSQQPISRADIARFTGLHRSTISDITEQLITERWIREGAFGKLPRGRNPRFLHLNNERAGIIGVDIRPTLTSLALTDLDARFIAEDSLVTTSDYKIFLRELVHRIQNMRNSHPHIFCEGIGVGLPGRIDPKTKRLIFAPNLDWFKTENEEAGIDVKKYLEDATGLPVDVDNIANACAIFETWFGKHEEGNIDLIALEVSEGIGTGIIVNDQIIRGKNGMAAEFGHISLNEEGPQCHCGNLGCWEVYASNTATLDRYMKIKDAAGAKKTAVSNIGELLDLYENGDVTAIRAIEGTAHYLGVGIAMLITGFAPSLIVIVGEITRIWEKIEPSVTKIIKEKSLRSETTEILPVNEMSHPRLKGAIMLVIQKHFASPSVG